MAKKARRTTGGSTHLPRDVAAHSPCRLSASCSSEIPLDRPWNMDARVRRLFPSPRAALHAVTRGRPHHCVA